MSSPPTSLTDRPSGAAASARIDALSAVSASWPRHDRDIEAFRRSNLVDRDTAEFRGYLDGSGPYPSYRLSSDDQVQQWVQDQHHAATASGDGDRHVRELLACVEPARRARPILAYLANHVEKRLTVDAYGTLGELAPLADEPAERYRWHPRRGGHISFCPARTPQRCSSTAGPRRSGTGRTPRPQMLS